MWILYALLASFFAGITGMLAKIGIKNTNSHVATAIRTIVVLLFTWIIVFAEGSHQGINDISNRALLFIILSGIVAGLSWICFFKALQLGDVNRVSPIKKSSIILTMIFAFIFLSEPVTYLKISGLFLIIIGTILMMIKKSKKISNKETKSKWLIYAVLSAVFAAVTTILGTVGIQEIESSNLGTAIRTIVVLIMAWIMVFVTNKQSEVRKINKGDLLFLVLSGIATGISWLFYFKALQLGYASVVAPIDKLSILVTMAFSYLILKEKFTKTLLLGLIVFVIGTILLII